VKVENFAPAKLNLYLHVGPPGPDGRHPLDSLAAFTDIGDTLVAAPSDRLTLVVDGPFADALGGEQDNLVLRAARVLAEDGRRAPVAALHLIKRLPVASGIGGGSADAAAALRALNTLWGLDRSQADLEAVAGPLGADVPVCVASRPALMSGTGETLAPAPALPSGVGVVLVNPGVPSPTGPVYRAFDTLTPGRPDFAAPPLPNTVPDVDALAAALAARRNDLESAAIALVPPITEALEALRATPEVSFARMSGSGATCFGLTRSRAAAEAACAALVRRRQDWWVAAGVLLG
jgi:4-diphosphocytidyl-2-C-methyl-D-erythritol kinase